MALNLVPAVPKNKKTSGKGRKKKLNLAPAKPKGAPAKEESPEDDGVLATAKDAAYGMAQGATFNFADELYGAGKAALEAGGGGRAFEEVYPQARDEARAEWSKSRERSPIATTVGEVGGAILSPGSKILGAGKGLKGIFRGAAEGGVQSYGATEKEGLKDQGFDVGAGAVLGGAVGGVMNIATKGYSKSPTATRAEVLGTRGRDYLVDGPADRQPIIGRITESGMLKNRKMEFDVNSMKFKPVGKKKWDLDELEMNTEERLMNRAQDAVKKLQDEKERFFGPMLDNRFVPASEIDNMAKEIADEYAKRGIAKGPLARGKAVKKIKDNIYEHLMYEGEDLSKLSLRQVDQLKKMAQEDVRNFSKSLGELGDSDELARITARKLKELVENNIGTDKFKKINSKQHDFLTAYGDIKGKIQKLDLEAPDRQQLEKTNLVEGLKDSIMGGSQGRLDRASQKEWWEKHIPKPARAVIPYAAEEAPGAIFRQQMQGQQDMGGNWRDPSGKVDNIPEQLIRTPLPRSTNELMEKKPFVLAKIAQMMPEMLDAVKDVFDHNPESLGEMAQVISMKMPHVFEKDKYNRFDGRIINEADKQKAIKDTLLKEELNSIEQAKVITKLNKTGEFDL